MINTILTYYNTFLSDTGLFEVNLGLAERVSDGQKEFYAIYNSDGGYSFNNQNFSKYRGLSYWYLSSAITNDPEKTIIPSKYNNVLTYPLGLICAIPRDLVKQDCTITTIEVMQSVAKEFSGNTKPLTKALSAVSVTYGSQRWESDRKTIHTQQYTGVEPATIDYKHHYFQINFNLNVVISSTCMDDICQLT